MKRDLDGFRTWLEGHGLTAGTVMNYAAGVELAGATTIGFMQRLRDEDLAPKTRRRILSIARRWAEFRKDHKFTEQLRKMRLPPARRKTARTPITREQLFALVDELGVAKYIGEPMRAVLGVMATRGLRVGDVLRIRRLELNDAADKGLLSFEVKGRKRLEFRVTRNWRRWLNMLTRQPGDWARVEDLISPGAQHIRDAASKAVRRDLIKVGTHCGITKLYPHRLRRTYATEYLKAQIGDPESPMRLQQHMQWSDVATALEYVDHDRGAELDKIAEKIFDRDIGDDREDDDEPTR